LRPPFCDDIKAAQEGVQVRPRARSNTPSKVKTHYLRGRDARHFDRWLGARSDVIYTIMSDEQRRPAVERPASLRVAAKIAAGFVEGLDRIADTLFALLLPRERFCLQRGWRK
jgi:hypothetical protein